MPKQVVNTPEGGFMSRTITKTRRGGSGPPKRARTAGRLLTRTLAAVVLAAAGPAAATAAGPAVPGKQPVLLADAPAGEFCSFPVKVTALDGTVQHATPGTLIVTGPLSVTVTNTSTGTSRTFNASGPTF